MIQSTGLPSCIIYLQDDVYDTTNSFSLSLRVLIAINFISFRSTRRSSHLNRHPDTEIPLVSHRNSLLKYLRPLPSCCPWTWASRRWRSGRASREPRWPDPLRRRNRWGTPGPSARSRSSRGCCSRSRWTSAGASANCMHSQTFSGGDRSRTSEEFLARPKSGEPWAERTTRRRCKTCKNCAWTVPSVVVKIMFLEPAVR